MGLEPNEKNKKSDGLAVLLRAAPRVATKPEELESALSYVFNLDQRSSQLTEGGVIVFQSVEAALQTTINAIARESHDTECVMEGCLGPEKVEIDVASGFGRLTISYDCPYTVESRENFSSARATHCYFAGKWMYEAILETGGIQQIGWATSSCPFTREKGVGDGEDSYAFDGKRVKKWSGDDVSYGQPWAVGDVIGCCADFDQGEIVFYRNGKSMGTAFREIRTLKDALGYFPAISLSEGERCSLNFGARPFYYPVDGYAACAPQPSVAECRLVQYLVSCLERLTEITASRSSPSASSVSTFPRSKLSVDEGVLTGSLLLTHLRGFLKNPFHITNALVPGLRRILGKADSSKTTSLISLIDVISNALSRAEFTCLMETIFDHLADGCRIAPFRASEFPYTASYPYLNLTVALLKSPIARNIFFGSDRVYDFLEQFLTRKHPTTDDLKDLLPDMWWKGCKDETMKENIMNAHVSTLSGAYLKLEQMQFDLLMLLVSEDLAESERLLRKPKNTLLKFLAHMLEKNAGAARNIPPPGLSNPTVMVSIFNFLMLLLRPYFIAHQTDEPDVLEAFPIRDILVEGVTGGGVENHEDIPRLGGLLSHMLKESSAVEQSTISVMIDAGSFSSELPRFKIPPSMIPSFLHILLLTFRLGIDTCIRHCVHQFQTENSQKCVLIKMESKWAVSGTADREKRQLSSEIQRQKEEVIVAIRESVWCRTVWFTMSKQKSLFLLIVYISKLITAASASSSNLIRFIPEVYVEAVVDIFNALARMETRFGTLSHLEMSGLQNVLSFFVTHFRHDGVINPQVSESILQALSTVFADKELLKACQRNPDAQQRLIPNLLATFDARHWLSVTNIFLSIAKGTGFGHGSPSSGSPVFRESLSRTCSADVSLLDGFLNRLFNTLNWTLTELVIALSELAELLKRPSNLGSSLLSRTPRKASVLFNLSVNLLRLLELVTAQVPSAFLQGPRIHISRAVEVVVYVLSHFTTGPDSKPFTVVTSAPETGQEWKAKMSATSVLAPVAGILIYIHRNSITFQHAVSSDKAKKRHSVVKILLEELTCPADQLHFLKSVNWKMAYTNVHKSQSITWLQSLLKDYDRHRHELTSTANNTAKSDPPDEFLDPIMSTLMHDPVVLPDSKINVDRTTIERHLLTSGTDPFTRAELSIDMLRPNFILQAKISEWETSNNSNDHK